MAEKLILEREELDQLAALVDDGGGITEITFASADAFLDYIRNADKLPCKPLSKVLREAYERQNNGKSIVLYNQKENFSLAGLTAAVNKNQSPATINFVERVYRLLNGLPLEGDPEAQVPDPAPAPQPAPQETPTVPIIDEDNPVILPSLAEMQALYDNSKDEPKLPEPQSFDSSSVTVYPKSGIRFEDNFYITADKAELDHYTTKLALIVNRTGRVTAVVELHGGNIGQLNLVSSSMLSTKAEWGNNENYDLILFRKQDLGIVLSGVENTKVSMCRCGVRIRLGEVSIADNPLCIDFGTSNTTAGSFGIMNKNGTEPELVEFADEVSGPGKTAYTIPTVVYVKDCSDSDNIEYLFGYKAQRRINETDYMSKASVFYEIKRWITTPDVSLSICDESGNVLEGVTHRSIIIAYLKHIISEAERYFRVSFKKLHFTAPVRLKQKFLELVTDALGNNYEIVPPEKALDEGVAVIYDYLHENCVAYSNIVRNEKNSNRLNESKNNATNRRCMVIDCGGGTTDVASCVWSIDYVPNGDYCKLKAVTKYENGDTNFGGNNVTFRILQLLKIGLATEIAEKYGLNKEGLNSDLLKNELSANDDTLEQIDKGESEYNKVYESFNRAYENAERIIPTQFNSRDSSLTEKKREKIRRNYFYLWKLAEKVKIEFYKINTNVNYIGFRDIAVADKDLCGENILSSSENFHLYYCRDNSTELFEENEFPGSKITEKNVENLIFGDIYHLLSHIMPQDTYDMHILSGQSCKIRLFRTLLKEFVPGKSLRKDVWYLKNLKGKSDECDSSGDSKRLKMTCIYGAINYMRDMDGGTIRPELTQSESSLLYSVSHNDRTILSRDIMADSSSECVKTIPDSTSRVDLIIYEDPFLENRDKLSERIIVDKRSIHFDSSKVLDSCSLDDLEQRFNSYVADVRYRSHLIDGIRGKSAPEMFFLLYPEMTSSSFHCMVIRKESKAPSDIYCILCDTSVLFDSNESHTTFFEGNR